MSWKVIHWNSLRVGDRIKIDGPSIQLIDTITDIQKDGGGRFDLRIWFKSFEHSTGASYIAIDTKDPVCAENRHGLRIWDDDQ